MGTKPSMQTGASTREGHQGHLQLKQRTKQLMEKALDAEQTEHLGHERHEAVACAAPAGPVTRAHHARLQHSCNGV